MSKLITNTIRHVDGSNDNITLDSSQNVTVEADLTIPDKIIHSGDTNTSIRFPAADTVSVETGGSERLRVNSTGRVGINESTPNATLHIKNADGGNNRLELVHANDSANEQNQITFKNNTTQTAYIISGKDGSNNNLGLSFGTGSTERMRIDSSGNVGIGTTSPNQQLHVYNSATDSSCYLKVENNRSRNAAIQLTTTQGSWYIGQGIGADVDRFMIYDSSERFSIDSNGYVTTPKVPCFWYSGLSNTQSSGAVSSDEVLVFSGEQHKNGTDYSTSNGRFTAPVAGNYLFGFNGIMDNNQGSNHRQVNIYRNGSDVGKLAYNYHTNGQYTMLSGTACLYLAKDDYAQIWSQAGMHVGSETSFWGTLIG